MITGQVRGREAVIPLSARRPGGHWVQLEAVIDTGFTEFLILPPSEIAPSLYPIQVVDGGPVRISRMP